MLWLAAHAYEGFLPGALIRIEDPDVPDAIVRSETGSVIEGPAPEGVPWWTEPIAEPDYSPAFEALEVTNTLSWHAEGHEGQGVRIAVFDPSFARATLDEIGPFSTHDCQIHPSCEVPFDVIEQTGVHGTACAEVIHDIAPGAEIFLVKMGGFTSFENGVNWAIRNDIDLISMSVSFYNSSFNDGTGPFAPLLERLERHDILLVTSAGNNAREHWQGRFVDADLDGRHDFEGDNRLLFDIGEGARRRLTLMWNQFQGCGASDFDLVATDLDGDILGRSQRRQGVDPDNCEPTERINLDVEVSGTYALEIHRHRGASVDMEMSVFARGGSIRGAVRENSVSIPADHPLAYAVGAIRSDRYLTAPPESFSSYGPNNAGWPKPDIAGPDRLSTSVYGPTGFSGTSASTPAVAGLLAVRMAESGATPRQAASWLNAQAYSESSTWEIDEAFGAGRARLPSLSPADSGCGRRPLLMPLLLLPFWRRRRRT